jgi:Flp pilus assembly protein TadG
MGALNWLNQLRKNESGNIIAVGAAALPMLIGTAAMAVDTIQLSILNRQLQRAADSGAIAGTYALAQNRTDAQIRATVVSDLSENPHPLLVGNPTVIRAPRAGHQRAVHVALRAQQTLPFMNMFTQTPARLTAQATGAIVSRGRYCMVSLYKGNQPGITLGGNATVKLGCGMITNSTAASAITTGGTKSWIEATPVGAVGGLNGDDNNFRGDNTQLIPYTAPQGDPFAHVPNPDPSDCSIIHPDPGDLKSITIPDGQPYCVEALTIKPSGSLTINGSGTVMIVGGNADIKGDLQMGTGSQGVTLVMTGTENSDGSVNAGTLELSSQSVVKLSPPTEGDYKDIVFYRDRRAGPSDIKVRGGSGSTLKGAFYAATSNFDYAGNSGLTARCLQMVGQIIAFTGTSDLRNECPEDDDVNVVTRNIVRLVE